MDVRKFVSSMDSKVVKEVPIVRAVSEGQVILVCSHKENKGTIENLLFSSHIYYSSRSISDERINPKSNHSLHSSCQRRDYHRRAIGEAHRIHPSFLRGIIYYLQYHYIKYKNINQTLSIAAG